MTLRQGDEAPDTGHAAGQLTQKQPLNRGYLYAGLGYGLWGLIPIYWKLLRPAGSIEILAHRIASRGRLS